MAWRTLSGLSRAAWPDASELRIGLGCMRLSTDEDADEERAPATIAAAAEAGITVFDTARSYGDNEGLLAGVLRSLRRRRDGADRHQGRHDAGRRRLGPRRPREGDPCRL